MKFKVGDIVIVKGNSAIMEVECEDEFLTFFLNKLHWSCISIRYDTIFDSYTEDEMRLATQEEIEEYLS